MATTPVFLPGESHGQRSLVGYRAWGRKESDTTEQLSTCGSTVDEADPSVNFLMCHFLYYFGTPVDRGAWWATVHGFTKSQA